MRAKQQRAILASHRHHSLLLQFGERRGSEIFGEIKGIVSGAHDEIEYRSQKSEVRSQNSEARVIQFLKYLLNQASQEPMPGLRNFAPSPLRNCIILTPDFCILYSVFCILYSVFCILYSAY